jgi:hypothetical protein
MSRKSVQEPPTVITLTLPESDAEARKGTLLVQRGDLARVHQFTYTRIADLTDVIADAMIAFAAVEADPPVMTVVPPPTPKPAASTKTTPPPPPAEPTVDIPLNKGKKTIKISHLKLVGGETDAAAYRQAVQIAALLIDGTLWDGESPIRIDDVYALAKKMKHLTTREMTLFALTDFVQIGVVEPDDMPDTTDNVTRVDKPDDDLLTPPHEITHSVNGHANGVTDQTALL